MSKNLRQMYTTVMDDHFPESMELSFVQGGNRQTLVYEKVSWVIDQVEKGLRYGENPGQEAALYRLINGNLALGDAQTIAPGKYLVSDMDLLRSGKHPGKTNLTDADNSLNILRYFSESPCAVIVKHNNPCGVACGASLENAYARAYMADRVAAFGGCIALNRSVDKATAEAIAAQYAEVVVAPDFEEGSVDILGQRKNLRVIRIPAIDKLQQFIGQRVVELKSLMDGGMIAQWSFVPTGLTPDDFQPATTEYKGETYSVNRNPTPRELEDMVFGWLVETGITSNSVIYVKDQATVGIGTGEQDRVGVAQIAVDKAYRKLEDRYCFEQTGMGFAQADDPELKKQIQEQVAQANGGLKDAVMVSDAFFPFRDGIDVGLSQGVSAVIQPGGSLNDYQSIQACNEYNAAMLYTGQRSFKH